MKKRKSWKQTNNLQKANFVWTQIKVVELLKKSQFSASAYKIILEAKS
jgi:hypothetical protein